jgi:L-ascorbate metabolism protein UlaG (beta-lactamase superfamily)
MSIINSKIQLPKLPVNSKPDYHLCLVEFGRFVENHCRQGCIADLAQSDNLLWQNIMAKMLEGLGKFISQTVKEGHILMLQWYNCGILLKTCDSITAFDLLPIPRFFGWLEPEGLTDRFAQIIDALFITHEHADHFDFVLSEKLKNHGKPVYMPDGISGNPDRNLSVVQNAGLVGDNIRFRMHKGCHVWRDDPDEIATSWYWLDFHNEYELVFFGDADYTKKTRGHYSKTDAVFITWRNPGPAFEKGHPLYTGRDTKDAVNIVIDAMKPERIILEHYGELDHVYKGFSSSYEMAVDLVEKLPVKTDVFFWGDIVWLR